MGLVFVTGFTNDSSFGNFFLQIGNKGPHHLRSKWPSLKFLKRSNYKINCNYWLYWLLFLSNSLHVNILIF